MFLEAMETNWISFLAYHVVYILFFRPLCSVLSLCLEKSSCVVLLQRSECG
jgi:hypothetical protein